MSANAACIEVRMSTSRVPWKIYPADAQGEPYAVVISSTSVAHGDITERKRNEPSAMEEDSLWIKRGMDSSRTAQKSSRSEQGLGRALSAKTGNIALNTGYIFLLSSKRSRQTQDPVRRRSLLNLLIHFSEKVIDVVCECTTHGYSAIGAEVVPEKTA